MSKYAALFADVRSAAAETAAQSKRALHADMSDEQFKALDAPFNESAGIVAGAGAGKTKLLVERAASLVRAGVDPQRIAVVTFTRKSAGEIKARLLAKFGDPARVPVCGTVHSVALSRMLSQKEEVVLVDDDNMPFFLDQLREELPEEFDEITDAELLLMLNRCREEEKENTTVSLLAYRFEELLAAEDAVDFTGLLKMAAKKVRPVFDYVLVDEAQDLSSLQLTFLKAIGRKTASYWFIGDSDQSIYAFRGAHGGVMQMLEKQVSVMYRLTTNYRSATNIVAHANNVISFNPNRFDIKWRAHRSDAGEVVVKDFGTGDEEMAAVRAWLEADPSRRAVLGRTQAVIASLRAEGLPAFTVHESKGLEWPEVWVVGCEAALFPHPLGVREEERRLFYVAMTRARDALIMSYASSRASKRKAKNERHPSPFLFEAAGFAG